MMKTDTQTIVGIDAGSVSIGIVQMTPDKQIVNTAYGFHYGDIAGTLKNLLGAFDLESPVWMAASASSPEMVRVPERFDDQICCIAAARYHFPGVGTILNVGGEKFNLIRLDPETREYLGSRGSTSCAAGTGAFLDQQALRLNLGTAARLSILAGQNPGKRPKIASRCAVFAKTDLIHAQQEGYAVEAVCDGLCFGLARNIVDTVLGSDRINAPLIFCGGVALNSMVGRYIEEILQIPLQVPERPELFGALGAALSFVARRIETGENKPVSHLIPNAADLVKADTQKETGMYPPLTLHLSRYPDFESLESFRHHAGPVRGRDMDVETDIYVLPAESQDVYLGIDIGSTSTKAVLTAPDGTVMAGFYTRTAGAPLTAVQRLFETIEYVAQTRNSRLTVLGAGTTGSGRKFIGRIIGADLVLDEITAHARAACELNPDVDTIIEIGGQDAKFTTLKDGRVTSAVMNSVCAAGTGSFIEEQAVKLDCSLDDYARRTENRSAPLSSDRCTVFMERDLNHYLSEGWDVDAVLASVLHSVRENYLLKVATESRIGDVIFFQGATAKNRALVAAFEQRLNRPIIVSRFCHLTGAIGAALTLCDERRQAGIQNPATSFYGLDLWRADIPIRSETCDLCTNHCKLSVATVRGKTVAYGFLCGRDYDTRHFVRTKSKAFDLMTRRKRVFGFKQKALSSSRPVIGLPAGGHLMEDLPRWRYFFDRLGFQTVTSEGFTDAVRAGKPLAKAEFCAPIVALHGHVHYLADQCDYIFLPMYLEDKNGEREIRRQFCYYTQFVPALVAQTALPGGAKILSPLIRYLYTDFHTRRELYRMFQSIPEKTVSFRELAAADDDAGRFWNKRSNDLKKQWTGHVAAGPRDIRIVFTGRPYTIFSPALNCKIPELFGRQGIDCCYQDMLNVPPDVIAPISGLLKEIHWRYAAQILETAQLAAGTPGLYPVFITSFKCSPDAFVRDYFKQIMEAGDKPYLILELDEHDSSIGYETRIEAAVRAFRNHFQNARLKPVHGAGALNPDLHRGKTEKTIVLPNWDRLSGRLLEAMLRREGLRVILMQETETSIRKSLGENSGQCIPLNAIAQGFAECIKQHDLRPEDTVLWLSESSIACNIALYPHHIKTLLNARGNGLEKAGVHVGDIFFKDVTPRAAFNSVFAYMFGGLLRQMACKLRPYEEIPGEVDRVLELALEILCESFSGRMKKGAALAAVTERFQNIKVHPEQRPKVAIFGDLYSRDNRVMNQDLIRFIERHGGEVVTTPYTEYARMIATPYFRKWFHERKFRVLITNRTLMAGITHMERSFYRFFEPILGRPMASFDDPPEEILARFGVRMEHTGESLDNLIKIHYIKKHYPDISLFVQASPAFCCPSLVTEAMAGKIEQVTGVPVVPITYDGTGGAKNDAIIPYLEFLRTKCPKGQGMEERLKVEG